MSSNNEGNPLIPHMAWLLVQVQSAHARKVLSDSQRDQLKMIIFGRPPLGPLQHLIHRGDPNLLLRGLIELMTAANVAARERTSSQAPASSSLSSSRQPAPAAASSSSSSRARAEPILADYEEDLDDIDEDDEDDEDNDDYEPGTNAVTTSRAATATVTRPTTTRPTSSVSSRQQSSSLSRPTATTSIGVGNDESDYDSLLDGSDRDVGLGDDDEEEEEVDEELDNDDDDNDDGEGDDISSDGRDLQAMLKSLGIDLNDSSTTPATGSSSTRYV